MDRDPAVMLAHTLRTWAQQLHFFVMDHGGAVVRGYAMSLDEALAEEIDVVIVDDVTSFVSGRAVERLHERGVGVVGVYEELDGDPGKWRLLELGVDGVLPAAAPPEAFVAEIARVHGERPRSSTVEETSPPRGHRPQGRLAVVGSAGGGSGATEIAITVAATLRSQVRDILLIDVDDQSPGLASRLRLPLAPNVLTAIDAHYHGSGAVEACIHPSSSGGVDTMPGIAAPDEWAKLRSGEVIELISALREHRPLVVANAGPRIEALPGHARARFGLARSIIASADVVVAVAVASPGGICRLLAWAVDARPLLNDASVHVVLNRHTGGRFVAGELVGELAAAWPEAATTVVPFDLRVPRAEWHGELVTTGPFTRAVERVAAAVGGDL